MWLKLLPVLCCPKCSSDLVCEATQINESDKNVVTGNLTCKKCQAKYPIVSGIPRFVSSVNYGNSFGYQWNQFKTEQMDCFNGTRLSEKRFYSETGWTKQWMEGKWILDAGCGAGRFLDIASQSNCEVIGVDISEAVDAAAINLKDRQNVHLIQASIYELPFRSRFFDGCYSIGVIQHTPDPEASIKALPPVLKPNGKIALTIYEKNFFTLLNSKYLIRPIAKQVKPKQLLSAIQFFMPLAFFISEVLFRIPVLGRFFMFVFPVANYVDNPELSWKQRYRWSILDTFDMLSPHYDFPQKQVDVERWLSKSGICEIKRLNNDGLNLIGNRYQ